MHQHRHEGDEYRRIEVITGVVRRRQWSAAEKAALIAENLQPGINVSALARRYSVSRGLLQTWQRTAMRQTAADGHLLVPLRMERRSETWGCTFRLRGDRLEYVMKWRVVLELVGADGAVSVCEIGGGAAVAEYAPRTIGLRLAEGKQIFAETQRYLVQAQTDEHCRRRRVCQRC
jgi:hypothetical protein